MKKLVNSCLAVAVLGAGPKLFAKSYIVVFRYDAASERSLAPNASPINAKSSTKNISKALSKKRFQYQTTAQAIHQNYLGLLNQQLNGKKTPLKIVAKDLWIARAAVVETSPQEIEAIRKEPWVHRVIEDRRRRYVSPMGQLKITDSLSELTDESERLWGLDQSGLYTLRGLKPTLRGKGIRVGILDTGIQSRHPEFKEVSQKTVFKDFVGRLENPYDDHGHGTHVAGTIAGVNTGFAPEASLIVGKIFGADGSGVDSEILDAMQWIADPDGNPKSEDQPHLVNNSWGADLAGDGPFDIEEASHFRYALESWNELGIVPVFAAGNSGTFPNGIPGGLPEALAVGATTSEHEVAAFSSQGPNLWLVNNRVLSIFKPDISAPGQDIVSAFPGNKYAKWSGTSMATPHVSGALALFMEEYPRQEIPVYKTALMLAAHRKTTVSHGFGVLDTLRLVIPETPSAASKKIKPVSF